MAKEDVNREVSQVILKLTIWPQGIVFVCALGYGRILILGKCTRLHLSKDVGRSGIVGVVIVSEIGR
jgi:hypothetical protein